jgi:Sensors of blue-light using FAD
MYFRLLYISTSRGVQSCDVIEAMVTKAQQRNRVNGLTGLLLYDGRRFLQYLEGEESEVWKTYSRIKSDPRHFGLVILRERHGEVRQFDNWDMAIRFSNDIAEYAAQMQKVVDLTQGVDILTSAELRGFVELRAA